MILTSVTEELTENQRFAIFPRAKESEHRSDMD